MHIIDYIFKITLLFRCGLELRTRQLPVSLALFVQADDVTVRE